MVLAGRRLKVLNIALGQSDINKTTDNNEKNRRKRSCTTTI